jgi:hypothetical protein
MIIQRFDRALERFVTLGSFSIGVDMHNGLVIKGTETRRIDVPNLTGDGTLYDIVLDEGQEQCLIVGQSSYGIAKVVFSLDLNRIFPLSRNQKDDDDYFHQVFVDCGIGVLFVYESGLLCFDRKLALKWERTHRRLDWHFKQVDDGRIEYESEYEGEWCYDLNTGEPIG